MARRSVGPRSPCWSHAGGKRGCDLGIACSSHHDAHHMLVTCSSRAPHMLITMLITCSSHAHHMLITCSSHAHHMLITCSSRAHHMLITCSSHAHHMLITCSSPADHTPDHRHRRRSPRMHVIRGIRKASHGSESRRRVTASDYRVTASAGSAASPI